MGAKELEQFLMDNVPNDEFKPYVYFSEKSQTLTGYLKYKPDFSRKLDSRLTVMFAIDDPTEVTGVRIESSASPIE